MTAQLLWRVQKFVAMSSSRMELQQNEIFIEFELWWKS